MFPERSPITSRVEGKNKSLFSMGPFINIMPFYCHTSKILLMERDARIFTCRSFMAAQLSIKLLCSQAPKVAKL